MELLRVNKLNRASLILDSTPHRLRFFFNSPEQRDAYNKAGTNDQVLEFIRNELVQHPVELRNNLAKAYDISGKVTSLGIECSSLLGYTLYLDDYIKILPRGLGSTINLLRKWEDYDSLPVLQALRSNERTVEIVLPEIDALFDLHSKLKKILLPQRIEDIILPKIEIENSIQDLNERINSEEWEMILTELSKRTVFNEKTLCIVLDSSEKELIFNCCNQIIQDKLDKDFNGKKWKKRKLIKRPRELWRWILNDETRDDILRVGMIFVLLDLEVRFDSLKPHRDLTRAFHRYARLVSKVERSSNLAECTELKVLFSDLAIRFSGKGFIPDHLWHEIHWTNGLAYASAWETEKSLSALKRAFHLRTKDSFSWVVDERLMALKILVDSFDYELALEYLEKINRNEKGWFGDVQRNLNKSDADLKVLEYCERKMIEKGLLLPSQAKVFNSYKTFSRVYEILFDDLFKSIDLLENDETLSSKTKNLIEAAIENGAHGILDFHINIARYQWYKTKLDFFFFNLIKKVISVSSSEEKEKSLFFIWQGLRRRQELLEGLLSNDESRIPEEDIFWKQNQKLKSKIAKFKLGKILYPNFDRQQALSFLRQHVILQRRNIFSTFSQRSFKLKRERQFQHDHFIFFTYLEINEKDKYGVCISIPPRENIQLSLVREELKPIFKKFPPSLAEALLNNQSAYLSLQLDGNLQEYNIAQLSRDVEGSIEVLGQKKEFAYSLHRQKADLEYHEFGKGPIVIFARPKDILGLGDLDNSEKEANIIKRICSQNGIETKSFIGEKASSRRLKEEIETREYGLNLHIACHGSAEYNFPPEASSLVLSSPTEQVEEGLVSYYDILNFESYKVDLVVLSCCRSALSVSNSGLAVQSLAFAFLKNGAKAVVASTQKVKDEITSIIMEHFYEALFQCNSPTKALQLVRIKFSEDPIITDELNKWVVYT